MIKRRDTKNLFYGKTGIGNLYPVSVQSMCNTDTRDYKKTIAQIKELEAVGCEIIRVAVPDEKAAMVLDKIIADISIPLVADIHFDHKLALLSIEKGVAALRINPGNIGSEQKVKEVVLAAKDKNIPIRIGVNAGSLEKKLLPLYEKNPAEAMVKSALEHINILEKMNFQDVVISLKSSNVINTIEAYELLAKECDYPFHIGITEAGTTFAGTIKSSVGMGILLYKGLGDTIRVSITGDPLQEVLIGYEILHSLELRKKMVEIISCPTCGRCEINLERLANDVAKITKNSKIPLKIAVMGCVVNGPGEARDADLGIAGGKGEGLIFQKGKIIKKVSEDNLLTAFEELLITYTKNHSDN